MTFVNPFLDNDRQVILVKIVVNFPKPKAEIENRKTKEANPGLVVESFSRRSLSPASTSRPKRQFIRQLVSDIRLDARRLSRQKNILDLFLPSLASENPQNFVGRNTVYETLRRLQAERGGFDRNSRDNSEILESWAALAKLSANLPAGVNQQNVVAIVALGGLFLGPFFPGIANAAN
jgi:hypothetical protein